MHKQKPVVIFCVALLTAFTCQAQFNGYYVQHFNSGNGFPNTIKGLQKDNNGFIWVATESGAVRFDGSKFKLYDHADDGTPVNRLGAIGLSSTGDLYVQANSNNYYYLNAANKLSFTTAAELFNHNSSFTVTSGLPQKLYDACIKKYSEKLVNEWAIPGLKEFGFFLTTSIVYSKGWLFYLNKEQELVTADTALNIFHKIVLPWQKKPSAPLTFIYLYRLFKTVMTFILDGQTVCMRLVIPLTVQKYFCRQ